MNRVTKILRRGEYCIFSLLKAENVFQHTFPHPIYKKRGKNQPTSITAHARQPVNIMKRLFIGESKKKKRAILLSV
jgi:hypothetical protein